MFNSVEIVLVFCILPRIVSSTNLEDELRVTYDQKLAIDKLRQRVIPFVTDDHMREDLNLLRWLRVTNFNLDKAEERMREDVKWRQQYKMSTILREDFSDMESEYPLGFTVDKQGQPVLISYAGEWDHRAATLTGRGDRLLRYTIQNVERLVRQLHQLQRSGHNVTRMSLIEDLRGFNIRQNACPACLHWIMNLVIQIETHFPRLGDKVIFVNTPPAMAIVAEVIRSNANPESWGAFKFYGRDKSVWQKALWEIIDRDKLPERLGGQMKNIHSNLLP